MYLMIACGGTTYFAQPDALKVREREREREFIFFILLGYFANFITRRTSYTLHWCTKVCNLIYL